MKKMIFIMALLANFQIVFAQTEKIKFTMGNTIGPALDSNAQDNLQNFFKSNAVVFSQDTLDGNTLETLKNRLKDVEIIGLGEQSHYDGATSIARVALIKYLHQKCNFSVIAFESGFYDCYKAYELAKNAKNKDSVLMEPVFDVFRVQEIKPLFEYIAATYQTTKPLKLVGFDHQFTSIISKKYFINDFMSFVEKEKIFDTYPKDYDKFLKELEKVIYMSNYGRTCSEETKQIISTYTKIIYQFLDKKSTKNLGDYLWMIICKNIDVEIIHYEKNNQGIRDRQMAINVGQIKKYLYPNEKMILWGASSHLKFNSQSVELEYHKNTNPIGDYLKKDYKEKYYFLGFTSYEGTWGKGLLSFRVKTPKKADSFEHNLREFTDKNAFVSLDLANNKLKEAYFTANVFGNMSVKMKIFEVADGIIYLRKMTKVHRITKSNDDKP